MEKWQQNSEELYCSTRHKHLVHYEPFSQKKGSSFSRRGQEGNHPKLRRLQQTKSTKSSGNSLHTSQLIQWSVNIINSGFSQGVPSQSSVLQSLLWVSTLFVFILFIFCLLWIAPTDELSPEPFQKNPDHWIIWTGAADRCHFWRSVIEKLKSAHSSVTPTFKRNMRHAEDSSEWTPNYQRKYDFHICQLAQC